MNLMAVKSTNPEGGSVRCYASPMCIVLLTIKQTDTYQCIYNSTKNILQNYLLVFNQVFILCMIKTTKKHKSFSPPVWKTPDQTRSGGHL